MTILPAPRGDTDGMTWYLGHRMAAGCSLSRARAEWAALGDDERAEYDRMAGEWQAAIDAHRRRQPR